jgi:hypothetical protein
MDNFHPVWNHAVSIELDDGPIRTPSGQRYAVGCFILQSQLVCSDGVEFRNPDWRDDLFGSPSSVAPQRPTAASTDSYGLATVDMKTEGLLDSARNDTKESAKSV